MPERSVSRALLRLGVLTTVAALAFGATPAFAQDDPASTPPAPAETSQPSSEPAPPPASDPAPQPASEAEPTATTAGVLFADKNRNGQQDPGEAIANNPVRIFGGSESADHETTSDANGRFSFRGLAPGTYHRSYELEDGWVVHHTKAAGDLITVIANETTAMTARAERPYSEQLKATATLDKAVYRIGDEAEITIRLTNRTGGPIRGIEASCNKVGDGNNFGGGFAGKMPESWGDLRPGKGVTLNPGETRTIVATEKVPNAARWKNRVFVACDFAPNPFCNNDGAYGFDGADQNDADQDGGTGGCARQDRSERARSRRGRGAAGGVRHRCSHRRSPRDVLSRVTA